MFCDRSEKAAFVNGMKAAASACAQHAVIPDLIGVAGSGGERLAMRPLQFDRSDRKKQRAWKIALCPDSGLGDRLFDCKDGHALAQLGRAERFDRYKIDRAG